MTEDITKDEMLQIIKKYTNEITPLIERQINNLYNHFYNNRDIARGVEYVYLIMHTKYEAKYGIGLVQTYMMDARAYYEALKLKQNEMQKAIINQKESEVVYIQPVRRFSSKQKGIDINGL